MYAHSSCYTIKIFLHAYILLLCNLSMKLSCLPINFLSNLCLSIQPRFNKSTPKLLGKVKGKTKNFWLGEGGRYHWLIAMKNQLFKHHLQKCPYQNHFKIQRYIISFFCYELPFANSVWIIFMRIVWRSQFFINQIQPILARILIKIFLSNIKFSTIDAE